MPTPSLAQLRMVVIQYLLDHKLAENSKARGEQFRAGLKSMMNRHPSLGDVRGKGLMVGFELVKVARDQGTFRPGQTCLGPAGTHRIWSAAW